MFSSSNNLKFAFLSELQKNLQEEKLVQQKNEQKIVHSWLEFEKRINSSPQLYSKFASLQNEFLSSSEIRKNYPSEFVSGILALNLRESEKL
jgi:uncharacterized protein (UPF0216 family)